MTQAYAPRHQRHGRINADGFGVGWYAPDVRAEPARYRTTTPMWADNSFASLAGVVSSGAIVAAVRNASPGLPVDESCTAPYTHEQLAVRAQRARRWASRARSRSGSAVH